jgi:hypothetical protein
MRLYPEHSSGYPTPLLCFRLVYQNHEEEKNSSEFFEVQSPKGDGTQL